MSIIEVLANKIADKISEKLILEEEKKAVITYGLIGILQVTTLFLLVSVLGMLTGTFLESLIIFFSVGFLRKSTGGAHAQSMWGCNAVSVISIIFLALSSRYVLGMALGTTVHTVITMAVFALTLFVFNHRVPVESPNKPIISKEKIKRLRKESFTKLFLLFILTMVLVWNAERAHRIYSISTSIQLAVLWQMITLTEAGAAFLQKIETAMSKVLPL